jgi:hypothetical protein
MALRIPTCDVRGMSVTTGGEPSLKDANKTLGALCYSTLPSVCTKYILECFIGRHTMDLTVEGTEVQWCADGTTVSPKANQAVQFSY